MAEYKGIKGFKVQYLSADPSDPIIGQTWYNSTSKDLKYTGFAAAGWATGNNMNTARGRLGSAGDGTTWATSPGSLNTARRILAGCWYTDRSFSFRWFGWSKYYNSNRGI
jgi:hypothetical protein